ncbi:hypothetical protein [Pseudomonas sp. W2-17]|uniref:hypothetical protein n=1 Tax=Pseudomonas sp. W2-17 TaxID=3058039 RepID=UPI0034E0C9CE
MHLHSFMYEVGEGVGEFLSVEEKAGFQPLNLPEIVRNSFGKGEIVDLVHAVILKRQIRSYIRRYMTADGLAYVYPPFGQETSFAEDYFEGDLYDFLSSVLVLLDAEIKVRRQRFFRF